MNCRQLIIATVVLLASFVLAPGSAKAACAPLSLCSCTVSATSLNFGNYDPLSNANDDSTGNIHVRCTLVAALNGSFTVDLSTGDSGSYAARKLINGSSELRYNLYTNSTRNQIWGDGTGGSVRVSRSFAGLLLVDRNITVYGRIDAGQNVPADVYRDTIIVTVTY